MPSDGETVGTLVFLAVFALPFCGAGLVAGFVAARSALTGEWGAAGVLTVCFLLFGGIGFYLVGAVVVGRRRALAHAERARAHPDEPWLWREDWAGGHVIDAAAPALAGTLTVAALWSLVTIAGVALVVRPVALAERPELLVLLPFPLVDIWLVAVAARDVRRYRRVGRSVLALATVPVSVGSALTVTIRTGIVPPPTGPFRVVLACVQRERSGHAVREHARWTSARDVAGTPVAGGTAIAVDVPIPLGAPGTDQHDPAREVVWRLDVSAPLPGLDYAARFELPIYAV